MLVACPGTLSLYPLLHVVSNQVWCMSQISLLMTRGPNMHLQQRTARCLLQNVGDRSYDRNALNLAFFVIAAFLLLVAAGCILWLCRTISIHRANTSAASHRRSRSVQPAPEIALWVPAPTAHAPDSIPQSAPGLGGYAASSLPLSEGTNLRAATAPVPTGSSTTAGSSSRTGLQEARPPRQPQVRLCCTCMQLAAASFIMHAEGATEICVDDCVSSTVMKTLQHRPWSAHCV